MRVLRQADLFRVVASSNGARVRAARAERMFRATGCVSALILGAAGEGVCGVDTDGLTTFINPAAERLLGWSAADLIGREINALTHHTHADGRHYPGRECPICNAIRFARVNRVDDAVFWRKDGRPIRVEYTSTPIMDGGRVQADITILGERRSRISTKSQTRLRRHTGAYRSGACRFSPGIVRRNISGSVITAQA